MAEEELLLPAAASPTPSDHKRKLDESSGASNADPDEADSTPPPSLESDAKRSRLYERSDDAAKANGHEEKSGGDVNKEATVSADPSQQAALVDLTEDAVDELRNGTNSETAHVEEPSVEDAAAKDGEETPQLVEEEAQPVAEGDVSVTATRQEQGDGAPVEQEERDAAAVKEEQGGDAVPEQQEKTDALVVEQQEKGDEQGDAASSQQDEIPPESEAVTRRVEVPNNKVGVLIGKAGDTIRFLQYNSKAKIQITRDLDADPHAPSRPVEITGSLESISKAEKLINAVIAEADAGGSPSLVARGVATAPVVAAPEQIQIQVPNDKVGLIIGRMGETIKSLQAKSGARIQLIPQHPPKGDEAKDRTVRVSGTMKQIDTAKEMINDVMNQTARPSGGFNHQTYRSHGQGGSQWGPRGSRPSQHSSDDYQLRGPYQSRNSQYPPTYGSYPQHMGPRGGFGHGWEQRPPPNMQGMPHGGGYDYYGGHGGDALAHHSARGPSPNPAMGRPQSQANYNYGHPHGSDYRHSAPYSHSAPPPQHGYGHGYEEPKYDNHAPTQQPYGGHGASQPYPQTAAQSGFGQQQQFGKPQAYTVPSQGPPPQSYGAPSIASQPGEAVYQAPAQPYGQNVPAQQPYPYASSAPTQQPYASYGSAPATDGYNQPPTTSTGGYPQQGGQPTTYGQPAPGYAQAAQAGYVQYPTAQQGYPEQPASYTGGYGYQGSQDPSYGGGPAPAYGAAPAAQQGYAQPAPGAAAVTPVTTQPQSIPQSGAYGKTVSSQPGYAPYDSSQMYAAPP